MTLPNNLTNSICLPLDNADQKTITELVKEAIKHTGNNINLIGCILHEAHDWSRIEKKYMQYVKSACESAQVKNYSLIVNDTFRQTLKKSKLMQVHSINFFALDCYYRINYLDQKVNASWNHNATSPLLLTG